MHDFCYVTQKEAKPVKEELYEIIHKVQDIVRDDFTFNFIPVGSSVLNMITYDKCSDIGYDFDINIEVNDEDEDYEPKQIRNIVKNAINQVAPQYGYRNCEDSTSVLTIKKTSGFTSQILHSCDFAIVYNCADGRQQYIRFNKDKNNYTWEFRGRGFDYLKKKIKWLKANKYWQELRMYYLTKKDSNNNPDKHSRSILAEAVNEMCMKKGFKN